MKLKQRQKVIGVVTIVAFLSFFLPTHFAHAIFGLPDVYDLVTLFFQTIFGLIGGVINVTSAALNYAVSVRAGGDIPVVATTWKILRDFSNMVFIVLLIYMAFATIFDLGKYTFKDMIVRFLFVAILINFSLVIGILVIDAVQVLTNIFLGSIGNIGDRLGQYLSPGELLPSTAIGATSLAGGGLVSLIFAVILSLILLFSMLVALAFAFIRVPFIWMLLIVSPLAWMSHILPGTEGWWKKWWSLFLGWNLFLPVYLFFIYLGLLFLSKRNEIINSVIQVGTTANPANDPLINTLTNGLTFNLLFFYVFAGVVMVGGTWAATKVTSALGGTGFEKGLGWAKGLVKKMPLPYVGNLQGAEVGIKARRDQFQQEGFKNPWLNKVYGGKDAQSRAEAKGRDFFHAGARDAGSSEFSKEVGTIQSRLKNMDTQQLHDRMDSGPEKEQLAVRELLKQRNQLTNAEQVEMYDMYARNDERAALNFANSIEYNKLSAPERQEWFNRNTNQEFRKKVASSMAEKGDYSTAAEVVQASTLFTSEADRAMFIKKAVKRLDETETRNILDPAILGRAPTREERTAINEALADKQKLSGTDIISAYNGLGAGSDDGEKFLSKIKFAALSEPDRRALFAARGQISDIEIQHKLYDSMAEKGELATGEIEMTARTYGGSEQNDFLTKAQKKMFISTSGARAAINGTNVSTEILGQIRKMDVKDLAALPNTNEGWANPGFQTDITTHLTQLENNRGPVAPRLTNPHQPASPANPWIPGKPGAGEKMKMDLLDATNDGTKTAIISAIPVP